MGCGCNKNKTSTAAKAAASRTTVEFADGRKRAFASPEMAQRIADKNPGAKVLAKA